VTLNVVVATGMWVRHGGLSTLSAPGGLATATGEIAGLWGTLAILAQLVLISRVPWIERKYGMDRLNHWHRWTGFGATILLTAHAVLITVGYAAGLEGGILGQLNGFVFSGQWMLSAILGLALIVAVAVSSMRAARRALSYETWWFIHLYAYLAIALSFMHQIVAGVDFVGDPIARWYWIGLYGLTAYLLFGFRWIQPMWRALLHDLRVADVRRDSMDVITITVKGRAMSRLRAEAGQFFILRFLRRDDWWKAHPFSLSAAPDGRTLRFTIKALGDDTAVMHRIPLGVRVMAEGPYGVFTGARATRGKVLLIGGGIGVSPIRAIYEDLDLAPGDVDLLYRARSEADAVLLDELRRISNQRGFGLQVSLSRPFGKPTKDNPFRPRALLARYPDLLERDVFVCGSAPVLAAAKAGLKGAGVPAKHIHYERFDY
jgi:predicted ferric reductase